MELTSAAMFLNSFFSGYDKIILTVMHFLAKLGVILTPLMKLITLLGEKGIIFFLAALVCMCFPRTRKLGVCIFGAVCCGALITNIILKDMIARPRPFETVPLFREWWQAVGSPAEDGFSFPSGHVTAAAAGMTALTLMRGKKWLVPSIVWVLLMMISRNYLMAHYPSDVLCAAIIGCASGFIAFFIARLIFDLLEAHDDVPLFDLILHFNLKYYLPSALVEKVGALTSRGGEQADEAPRRERRPAAEPEARGGSHSRPAEPRKSGAGIKGALKATGNIGYKGKHDKR